MRAPDRLGARARLSALAVLAVLTLPGAVRAQGDDPAGVPRISQAEFKQALSANAILVIDVRDKQDYSAGHIPGAVSMPLAELDKFGRRLKAESRPIVAYCA